MPGYQNRYKAESVQVESKMRDLLEHAALGGRRDAVDALLGKHGRHYVSNGVKHGMLEIQLHLTPKGQAMLADVRKREAALKDKL